MTATTNKIIVLYSNQTQVPECTDLAQKISEASMSLNSKKIQIAYLCIDGARDRIMNHNSPLRPTEIPSILDVDTTTGRVTLINGYDDCCFFIQQKVKPSGPKGQPAPESVRESTMEKAKRMTKIYEEKQQEIVNSRKGPASREAEQQILKSRNQIDKARFLKDPEGAAIKSSNRSISAGYNEKRSYVSKEERAIDLDEKPSKPVPSLPREVTKLNWDDL
jgi:hypothetical protein